MPRFFELSRRSPYIRVLQDGIARMEATSPVEGIFTTGLEDCIAIILRGSDQKTSMIHKTLAFNLDEIIEEFRWVGLCKCYLVYNPGYVSRFDPELRAIQGLKSELAKRISANKLKLPQFIDGHGDCVSISREKGEPKYRVVPDKIQSPPYSNVRDIINFLNNMFSVVGKAQADRQFVDNQWTELPALNPDAKKILEKFVRIFQDVHLQRKIEAEISQLLLEPMVKYPFVFALREAEKRSVDEVNKKTSYAAFALSKTLTSQYFRVYLSGRLSLSTDKYVDFMNAKLPVTFVVYSDGSDDMEAVCCFDNQRNCDEIAHLLDGLGICHQIQRPEISYIESRNVRLIYTIKIQIDVEFKSTLAHFEEKSPLTVSRSESTMK